MKRRFLFFILIIFSAIIISSNPAFSDSDLNIDRWSVDARLLTNGNLQISEDITFNFKNKFNGVYRSIVLESIDSVENLFIYELVDGKEIEYEKVEKAKKGDSNKYSSNLDDNNLELKIFSPSKDEIKTFRLNYTLANVAVSHPDIGELYYKFLGKENESHIDYFSVNLQLPSFEKSKIKIFAHGPKEGKIYFTDQVIKSEVSDVGPENFIEHRVLFPKEYISNSPKKGNKSYQSIIEEEKSFVEEQEEAIKTSAKRKSFFSKTSIYLSLAAIVLLIILFYRFRRSKEVFDSMDSLYPDDLTPAELSLFINKASSPRSLLASLFDLSLKGYIDIEELDDKPKEYVLTRTDKKIENLTSHEVFLLSWIFEDIRLNKSITTLDLESYRKNNTNNFYRSQIKWNKLIKENLKERNYYDTSTKKWTIGLIGLSLVWFVIGITSLIFKTLYGLLPLFIGVAIFIFAMVLLYRTNDKGYIQYNLWKEFLDEMKKNNNKSLDIMDDKALIYSIALGLPMEKLDNYRTSIDMDYYPINWGYIFFLTNPKGGSRFEDSFTHSFYGYSQGSSSTSQGFGGGGGFTGGGGGGAGGGGAGGF